MKKRFRAKKIPDDYHTLDRARQVILMCLRTGYNGLNSRMHRRATLVPSSLCTCETEDQNSRTHTAKMSNISGNIYGQTNIITPEAVWEERNNREQDGLSV